MYYRLSHDVVTLRCESRLFNYLLLVFIISIGCPRGPQFGQVLASCGQQGWGCSLASVARACTAPSIETVVGKQRLYVERHHDLVVLDLLTADNAYEVSFLLGEIAKKADKSYEKVLTKDTIGLSGVLAL